MVSCSFDFMFLMDLSYSSDYDRNVFQISNSLNVLIKFIKDTHALKGEISGYGATGISPALLNSL